MSAFTTSPSASTRTSNSAATILSRCSCIFPSAASFSASITCSPVSREPASAKTSHGSGNISRDRNSQRPHARKVQCACTNPGTSSGRKLQSVEATRMHLPSAGTAYTEVPAARDKEEFFAGLRSGMGRVRGESGSFAKLTRDCFLIAGEMMREKSWTTLLAPLGVLLPAFTWFNYFEERQFSRRWAAEVLGEPEIPQTPSLDHLCRNRRWRNGYDCRTIGSGTRFNRTTTG